MKLTARLVAGIILVMILLMVANAYLSVSSEIAAFDDDMARDVRQLGRTLKDLIQDAWPAVGQETTLHLIAEANEEESGMSIRWVWLDEQAPAEFRPAASRDKLAAALAGEVASFKTRDAEGVGHFYTYVPVEVNAGRPGALELAKSLARQDELVYDTIVRTAAIAAIAGLAMALLVVALGITLVGRPLDQLIERTRRIGQGDLASDPAFRARDELGELGAALDAMCVRLARNRDEILQQTEARIAALEQLRHADRLKTVGQLASGIAHELGTPLNIITGRLDLIHAGEQGGCELGMNLDVIRAQCDRMTRIIRQLLDFARRRTPEKACTDLGQLVWQVLEFLRPMMKERGVELKTGGLDRPIQTEIDRAQIQQVVTNIVVNGIQAMRGGGLLEVAVRQEQAGSPDFSSLESSYLCVEVKDQGSGISPSDLERIFDPFFSTKEVGEGTGLGLSIAHGIVKEHGGWISVSSVEGKGSRFSVYLPEEVAACVPAY